MLKFSDHKLRHSRPNVSFPFADTSSLYFSTYPLFLSFTIYYIFHFTVLNTVKAEKSTLSLTLNQALCCTMYNALSAQIQPATKCYCYCISVKLHITTYSITVNNLQLICSTTLQAQVKRLNILTSRMQIHNRVNEMMA